MNIRRLQIDLEVCANRRTGVHYVIKCAQTFISIEKCKCISVGGRGGERDERRQKPIMMSK